MLERECRQFALTVAPGSECRVTNINMTTATCALCGAGVHIDDHEGRVACNGCGMATDNCTCTGEDLQDRAGRSKGWGTGNSETGAN